MNLSGQKKMNLKKYEIRWLKGNEFEEHIIKKDMLNISNHDDYQQLLWFSRRTETKIMSVGTIDMVVLKNCWNIDSITLIEWDTDYSWGDYWQLVIKIFFAELIACQKNPSLGA